MGRVVEDRLLRNRVGVFRDRFDAAEKLAEFLREYGGREDALILAVPAGGVPVGYVLSKKLDLPLDVVLVRKLHIPWNQEAGFGAIALDGTMLVNWPLARSIRLTEDDIQRVAEDEKRVLAERKRRYRGDRPDPKLSGKSVILVDDGLASGFTMLVAARCVRKREPKEVVVAVPTASQSAIELISPECDLLICLNIRTSLFFAVADAYQVWYDVEDDEVVDLLKRAWSF